jgi:hypothetical protein
MYDEILKLGDFLPIKPRDPRVDSLITHHYSHLQSCVKNELYSSSLVHLHILYMVIVYLQIQRITEVNQVAFTHSLIGFAREESNLLKEPNYPLLFSIINEKTVFRFFRLNGLDEGMISNLSGLVTARNRHMHASADIECETAVQFNTTFEMYLKNIVEMVNVNKNVHNKIYIDSEAFKDLNDPSYEITDDDIELGVLLPGYFSLYELKNITAGRADKLSMRLIEAYK